MVSWVRTLTTVPRPTTLAGDDEAEAPDDLKRPRVKGRGRRHCFAATWVGAFALANQGLLARAVAAVAPSEGPALGHYAVTELPGPRSSGPGTERPLRVVVISDTHEFERQLSLPPGDILLHCGDFLISDKYSPGFVSNYNLRSFFAWMNRQPFALRIVVGGNHDHQAEKLGVAAMREMAWPTVYLEDELVDVAGLRVFGTPRSTPNSAKSPNRAFQSNGIAIERLPDRVRRLVPAESEEGRRAAVVGRWSLLDAVQRSSLPDPDRVDFLLSHGAVDDPEIQRMVARLDPAVHCFGHVHEMRGVHTREGCAVLLSSAPPARPSIGAATLQGTTLKEWCAPPLVFDYTPHDAAASIAALATASTRTDASRRGRG